MNTLLSSVEVATKPPNRNSRRRLRKAEHGGQRDNLELTDFGFAAVVRDLSIWAVGTETGAVVSAPPCGGKTWAAEAAQAAVSKKGASRSVLILKCKFCNNPKEFRAHIAHQLNITGRDIGPQRLLELAPKRLSKKHVGLIILDDAHALSPEGQAFLWNLIRDVKDKHGRLRKLGIIALVIDDSVFAETAIKFGRFLRKAALPLMSPDEVANYLAWQCPALKAAMEDPDQQEAATLLNRDLCVNSQHRPVLLHGLIEAVKADPELGPPTLNGFHTALKRHFAANGAAQTHT